MERIPQNQTAGNTPSEALSLILSKVTYTRSGAGYSFKCPAHDDKRNSAYVKADAKGNVILKCFAGCTRKAICEALGITESDLYVQKASTFAASQTTARYRYYDEAGRLLYDHLRMVAADGKKTFLYCRMDATGNSLWTLYSGWFELKGRTWKRIEGANDPHSKPKPSARWFDESKRVLYRLSALRKAQPGTLVLYCEGEKDVENAEALGFVATTAGSASDWRTEFADALQGFDLVIIPDNDEAGQKCAAKVARDCFGLASRVRVVELPGLGKGGDLSDWIHAGGTKEKLLAMLGAPSGQNVHLKEDSKSAISELSSGENVHLKEDTEKPLSDDSRGQNVHLKEDSKFVLFDSRGGQNVHLKEGLEIPLFGLPDGENVHLKEEPEIDLSDLHEVEDDDPPISSDPKREMYLRQLARNTAKVNEACAMILQLLGFEKNHARLLNALIAIGGDRLRPFRAYQVSIRERYGACGQKVDERTVRRDITKLREEQAALGVAVISYWPGSMDFATGKSYPGRFQNRLLRYALEAINISIDTRQEFKTARKALEAACQIVVESIPRVEPVLPKEKKPKQPQVEDLEARYLEAEKRLIDSMVADGWAIEEIEEEFERLASFRAHRFKEAEQRKQTDPGDRGNNESNNDDEEEIYFE